MVLAATLRASSPQERGGGHRASKWWSWSSGSASLAFLVVGVWQKVREVRKGNSRGRGPATGRFVNILYLHPEKEKEPCSSY